MKKLSKKDIEKLPTHKDIVRFAIFCAEQVLHLTDKPEAKVAVNTARRWLVGEATSEECKVAAVNAASTAAYATFAAVFAADAATDAAAYVTFAAFAADAAFAAADATSAANAAANAADAADATSAANATIDKQKIIEEQWNYYNELLYVDDILEEEIVLCNSY